MISNRGFLGLALAFAVLALPARSDEEADERMALGRRAFVENCLMCHAEELTTRSRLTPTQWAAEVGKMAGWGAPVPPEQQDALRDYLTRAYPETAPTPPPARMTLAEALDTILPRDDSEDGPAGDPGRGASLYATNCANCHGAEARGGDLGTNLVERPVLVRPDDYQRVVREGIRRMPGFEKALDHAQEADILAWLRDRRYRIESP